MRSSDQETDDFFRKGFENLSEDSPGNEDWKQMLPRLKKEGLIVERKNRKGFFLTFSLVAAVLAFVFTFYFYDNNTTPNHLAENKNIVFEQQEQLPTSATDFKEKENTVSDNISEAKLIESGKNTPGPAFLQLPENTKAKQPLSIKPVLANDTKKERKVVQETSFINEPKGDKIVQQRAENNSTLKAPEQSSVETPLQLTSSGYLPLTPPSEKTDTQVPFIETQDSLATSKVTVDSVAAQIFAVAPVVQDSSSKSTVMPVSENPEINMNKNARRFWIGYYLSRDITHYALKDMHITENSDFDYVGELKKNVDTLEKQLQFTTGLMGGYLLSDRFSIESGVFYSQKKKVQSTLCVVKYDSINGASTTNYIYYYNAQYLEVYGRLKYYFIKGKFSFYVAPGVLGSFNFPVREEKKGYFIREAYSTTTVPQLETVTLQLGSVALSATLSVGAERRLSEKWSFYVEPSFKYAFNPVINHPTYDKIPVNHFWRTMSFGIGCMYHF